MINNQSEYMEAATKINYYILEAQQVINELDYFEKRGPYYKSVFEKTKNFIPLLLKEVKDYTESTSDFNPTSKEKLLIMLNDIDRMILELHPYINQFISYFPQEENEQEV